MGWMLGADWFVCVVLLAWHPYYIIRTAAVRCWRVDMAKPCSQTDLTAQAAVGILLHWPFIVVSGSLHGVTRALTA
jgi:hypothetical protein